MEDYLEDREYYLEAVVVGDRLQNESLIFLESPKNILF